MTLTTSDPKRLAAELTRQAERYPRAATAGLYQLGHAVGERALPRTPIDEGTLRSTLYVTPPTEAGGDVVVEVGYGTRYAARQHFELTWHHPVGEALFLQKGFDEVAGVAESTLARLTERNAALGIGVGAIPAAFPAAPGAR